MKYVCNDDCPYLFEGKVCIHFAYLQLKNNSFNTIQIDGKSCLLQTLCEQKSIVYDFYHSQEIIPNPREIFFVDSQTNSKTSFTIIGKQEFYDIFQRQNFIRPYYEENDKSRHYIDTPDDLYKFLESDCSTLYNYKMTKDLNEYYETQLKQLIQIAPEKISNLSLTSTLYSSCEKNEDVFFSNEQGRKTLFRHLRQFVESNESYFYFTGPVGIGKTTSLLLFQRIRIGSSYCFYLNLKYLKVTYKTNHFLENLLKELLILFSQTKLEYFKVAEDISNMYRYHWKEWSFSIFLQNMIKHLITYQKNFIFIFDQYKQHKDDNNFICQQLKDMIIKGKNKIKVIVCSSINDKKIGKGLKNYWLEETYLDCLPYKYYPELIRTQTFEDMYNGTTNEYGKLFNYLPHYMKKFNNVPETKIQSLLSQIEQHIKAKILELYNQNYLDCYNSLSKLVVSKMGTPLDKKDFINIVGGIPLKYITVKTENEKYVLSYQFPFVKIVITDLLAECSILMKIEEFQKAITPLDELSGDFFEKIIHNYIIQRGFFNITKMTKIIVDSVISLNVIKLSEKEKNKKRKSKENINENKLALDKADHLYLTQHKKNAKHFDSAILFNRNDRWQLILFQITMFKQDSKRLSRSTILDDCYLIQKNIKNISNDIEININDFHFFYIFCLEHFDSSTFSYCQNNKISYLIYSVCKNQFLSNSLELNQYTSVNFRFNFFNEYPFLNNARNTLNIVHNTVTFLQRKTQRKDDDKGIEDILNFNSIKTKEELLKIIENKEQLKKVEDFYLNFLFLDSKEIDFKYVCQYSYKIYTKYGYKLTFLGCEKSKGNCSCSNKNIIIVYQIKEGGYILFEDSIYVLDTDSLITKKEIINSMFHIFASESSVKFYYFIN